MWLSDSNFRLLAYTAVVPLPDTEKDENTELDVVAISMSLSTTSGRSWGRLRWSTIQESVWLSRSPLLLSPTSAIHHYTRPDSRSHSVFVSVSLEAAVSVTFHFYFGLSSMWFLLDLGFLRCLGGFI